MTPKADKIGISVAIVLSAAAVILFVYFLMSPKIPDIQFKSVKYPNEKTSSFIMALFNALLHEGMASEEKFRVYIAETDKFHRHAFKCQVISDCSTVGFAFIRHNNSYEIVEIDYSKQYPIFHVPNMNNSSLIYVFRLTAKKDQLFSKDPIKEIELKVVDE